MQDQEFSFEGAVHNIIFTNRAPGYIEGNTFDVIVLNIQWLYNKENSSTCAVKPSDECMTKVLTEIGVLHPGENINDLKMVPSSMDAKPGNPHYSAWNKNQIEKLPTNLQGVTAKFNFEDNFLSIQCPIPMLEKIVAFPASV